MITPKLLRDWSACWDDDCIAEHFAGHPALTPRQIAADESISLDDRLWVMCRALWYRSESLARAFAIDSAALVSHLAGRPEDCAEHARLVNDLRRIYTLNDGDRAEQSRAWDAAWAAARAAARAAAWAAARAAARAAAWAAARAAAWAAARAAAWDEAWAAARAAAWDEAWAAARAAARDEAWAAARAAARDEAWAAELRKAIDRALSALGPDADGWEDGVPRCEMIAAQIAANVNGIDGWSLHQVGDSVELIQDTSEAAP